MSAHHEHSGFFLFRSPLLSFDELEDWGTGLEACAEQGDLARLELALERDRARLRSWLSRALERPEIAEALFLASPSLVEALARWRTEPDSRKGRSAEAVLVRYIERMASRSTPFGLFAGCTVGSVDGRPTCFGLGPRGTYGRHTRLDMDYLFALCEDLAREPALRQELVWRPNSSLYATAGRLRYAAASVRSKLRSHRLVAVEPTSYLEATLARAADGARAPDLAAALVCDTEGEEVSLEDASEYIDQLIEQQVLVCDLTPDVTGPEAIQGIQKRLESLASGHAKWAALESARRALTELDSGGLGANPNRYRAIADDLGQLPTSVDLSRLFQLDMVKPAHTMALGPVVIEEIARGTALLHRLFGRANDAGLDRFRKQLGERYGEGRWMPLSEVLDEETGIGFERSEGAAAEASPLLQGIPLGRPAVDAKVTWGPLQSLQLRKLESALSRGEQEIELTADDLAQIPEVPSLPLPDAMQAIAVVAAKSAEDVDQGRFSLLLKGVAGPSGARLLGRFCHADSALEAHVRAHLEAEEALRPDAVFAEIVHLPEGRLGNILCRPVMRSHEIPYLGRSGTPADRQIPITDLQVRAGERGIELRSERLGRQVIPRLSSAHNFTGGLGVYRFLCALQADGVLSGVDWSWGPLESASFLPRIRCGRLVLSRARWRVTEEEIEALLREEGATQFIAVQTWRAERRLPRRVLLGDSDNELLVDFDNVLSVAAWLDVIKERKEARLIEMFPEVTDLCARGPEGRFVHEVVVPFVRTQSSIAGDRLPRTEAAPLAAEARAARSFSPGSEWLYAKLYVGTATADAVLRDLVGPLVRSGTASGAIETWFFIRYGDPEWHLRLRFRGDPSRLRAEILPRLTAVAAAWLSDGRVWRSQIDTYDREVERYGGPAGIEHAERLFHTDSDAAISVLEHLEGDEGADARWRLALLGTDRLLRDLEFSAAEKRTILDRLRASYFAEFGGTQVLRRQLDQKYRTERPALERLLATPHDTSGDLAPVLAILRRRSERNVPHAADLRRSEREGRLTSKVEAIAPSLIHMQVNRWLRSAHRAQELVLYDLLARLYESQEARERRRTTSSGPAPTAANAERASSSMYGARAPTTGHVPLGEQ